MALLARKVPNKEHLPDTHQGWKKKHPNAVGTRPTECVYKDVKRRREPCAAGLNRNVETSIRKHGPRLHIPLYVLAGLQ